MGHIDKYFPAGIAGKHIMSFLGTYNMESQVLDIDVTAQDIQDTGTKGVMINGIVIPALPVDAALDISADPTGNAVGTVITDGEEQYFAVLAAADGTLSVWVAGTAATTGSAELKIPDYDPATYVVIGLMLVDASGADFTIGTTALTSRVAFYQVVGPCFPHPDNIDND